MPAHQLEPAPGRCVEAGICGAGKNADELERVAEADVPDLPRCSQGRVGVNSVDGTAELRDRFPGSHERMFAPGSRGRSDEGGRRLRCPSLRTARGGPPGQTSTRGTGGSAHRGKAPRSDTPLSTHPQRPAHPELRHHPCTIDERLSHANPGELALVRLLLFKVNPQGAGPLDDFVRMSDIKDILGKEGDEAFDVRLSQVSP